MESWFWPYSCSCYKIASSVKSHWFKLCWIPESLSKTVSMPHFCQGSHSRITKGWFLIFVLTGDATDWTGKETSLTICERPQSELKLDYLSTGLERGMHCGTVLWHEKLSELKHPLLLWKLRHLVFCLLHMITYIQQTELISTYSYSELLINYNVIAQSKIITWSETCCSESLNIDNYLISLKCGYLLTAKELCPKLSLWWNTER